MEMLSFVTATIVLAGVACADFGAAAKPDPGAALIKQMRDRYPARAATGFVLSKNASFADGRKQRWHEALLPPGLRRLDIAPVDSFNGLVFRADSLYEIARGATVKVQPYVHALSLLSYDVYAAPTAETAARLAKLGFDLKLLRVTTWQDRPTYVVGAHDGDRTSNQFWIDRDSLYLVRLIERRSAKDDDPKQPPLVQEIWLSGHRKAEGQWIPTDLNYFYNGRQFLHEQVEIHPTPTTLDSSAFQPQPWRRPAWTPASE